MSDLIKIDNLSYTLPNGDLLFSHISFSVSMYDKVAIIGNNGVGKSTLLKTIMQHGKLHNANIHIEGTIEYISQDIDFYQGSVAHVLGVEDKIYALKAIRDGNVEESLYDKISNDWDIEDRIKQIFEEFHINQKLDDNYDLLSGGEKERLLLAKAFLSNASILIFDEPTNNLDYTLKEIYYRKINNIKKTILIVSHDRELLSCVDYILELSSKGVRKYSGDYAFYCECKKNERKALENRKSVLDKEISKLVQTKINIAEQKDKSAKQGKMKIKSSKYSSTQAGSMKGLSESSAAQKNKILDEKISKNKEEAYQLGWDLKIEPIKIPLPKKPFIKDRLVVAKNVCFSYDHEKLIENMTFIISGQDRIQIKGRNGSGKSTLVKIILGQLLPCSGEIKLNGNAIYLDQTLSLLDRNKSLLENMLDLNQGITILDAHSILAQFKFRNVTTEKLVKYLSGGELLRASLAIILGTQKQPELIILDEPTNNLDIESTEVLEEALSQYQGAIIVISHDKTFLDKLSITNIIEMK